MALTDRIYVALTNDEDASPCTEIGEASCHEAPASFSLILLSNFLTKLADAIASPKTTLAWLSTAVGAPAFVLGFLVPIRESGSMIPQLFIGSVVRKLPIRKWVWVLGSCGQCLCVVGMGVTAWFLDGVTAGWVLLGLVAVFSLARAFSSVAAKDVLGKTIPRNRRGQLTGWSAGAAGLVSIGVGVALMLPVSANMDASFLGWLLVAAGSLWFVAASVYARVPEYAGETGGGRNAMATLRRLGILLSDKPFRRFVTTRALLMCSALSAPFYVALAQSKFGSPTYLLGAFVAAAGIADLVTGPLWGRLADMSSKRVMIVAGLITSGIGIATFLINRTYPDISATSWFLPLAYFVLCVGHSGVRVGRKIYVVNLADGNQRTDYVTISNTIIGVLLLLVGSVGLLAPLITNAGIIGLLAFMGLGGATLGSTLPDVSLKRAA